MRFQPKSRASTDQTPGPSSAKATPIVPNRMLAHGSPDLEIELHSASTATNDPAMGVHRPANRNIPTMIANMSTTGGPARGRVAACAISAAPVTSRMKRRPTPGQPHANVEYSLRTIALVSGYRIDESAQSPKRVDGVLFRVI